MAAREALDRLRGESSVREADACSKGPLRTCPLEGHLPGDNLPVGTVFESTKRFVPLAGAAGCHVSPYNASDLPVEVNSGGVCIQLAYRDAARTH